MRQGHNLRVRAASARLCNERARAEGAPLPPAPLGARPGVTCAVALPESAALTIERAGHSAL